MEIITEIARWSQSLVGIAQTGLNYASDPYADGLGAMDTWPFFTAVSYSDHDFQPACAAISFRTTLRLACRFVPV